MSSAISLRTLDAALRAGLIDDVDLHFARAVAAWHGEAEGAGPVVLAAALVSHLAGQGHVCLDLPAAAGQPVPFASDVLAPPLAIWVDALKGSAVVGMAGMVATAGAASAATPLVLDGPRLYLGRYWQHEQAVASRLRALATQAREVDTAALDATLMRLLPGDAQALAGQRQAVHTAVRSGVTLISGGPGTGKTTTLAALLAATLELSPKAAMGHGLRILLAAPTGKAAARMQDAVREAKARLPLPAELAQAIPETARTLHRLLGLRPDGSTRHHGGHPLPCDLLVVDEASMVDLSLMNKTLAALPSTARLVLLGDRDQLASVEAGAVFADLCASAEAGGALASGYAQLTHSFRFGGEAGIGQLARALRAGDGAAAIARLNHGGDGLAWQRDVAPERLLAAMRAGYGAYIEAVAEGREATELHRHFNTFRVLSAYREGPVGVRRLNEGMEHALGVPRRQRWYAGRPVMITANDYGLGLFNGDIGITTRDAPNGDLHVCFVGEQGLRTFAPNRLPAHETAWAMTVHKSQGSEFDRVLVALPDDASAANLLTRELLYTAVTRAKKQVEIWGTAGVIEVACQRKVARLSGLGERLG